jgi:hypothetical protein
LNLNILLTSVIEECRKSEGKPKLSSRIKQWLGRDIPQSLSIRIGNYIEAFFAELTKTYSILDELEVRNGQRGIVYDNQFHQVDLLLRINNVIYHREIKCNLDLDRGKKRDVIYRETCIVSALEQKYQLPVDSCVFSPFIDTSQDVSEGLTEFIDNFNVAMTLDEFKQLGRNEQIHRALLNETIY